MEFYKNISDLLKATNVGKDQRIEDFYLLKVDAETHKIVGVESKEPYKNDFFEVVISTSKNVNVRIGDEEVKGSTNSNISFTSKNQLTSWNASDVEHGVTYIFFFNPEFIGLTSDYCDIYQALPHFNIYTASFYYVEDEELISLIEIAEKIVEEQTNYRSFSEEIIKSYFKILLFSIKRMLEPVHPAFINVSRQMEITYNFENLIKSAKNKRKPISEYAGELNISQVYLSECVKKTTGKSAKKVIDDYLVSEAKSILFQTLKPVSEIAVLLGFDDLSNFVKYFKTQTGITPKAFRDTNT
ncbi:MAG: helix-turn-helix domain-containing protein [Rhodothermaceae bacterium]